jgi:arylsulfatase A-like enzyme
MPNGQPNILILWGDDIGQSNLSCYSLGLMGYQTPNIDRLAREGAKFIHYYAEQSCTAGRAAFITGQSVYRTGLSKVGLPGAELGFRAEDPTIAELLQPLGYRTGQFGKNHFGDRDEHLPTMHGFDEFFGNLYHLNAEEEPELRDYPREDDPEFPNFRKRFAPRGVLQLGEWRWHPAHREHRPPHPQADGNRRRRVSGGSQALHPRGRGFR